MDYLASLIVQGRKTARLAIANMQGMERTILRPLLVELQENHYRTTVSKFLRILIIWGCRRTGKSTVSSQVRCIML